METNADMSLVKLANYRRVWNYVHSCVKVTVPQISKQTGLSLPTVTRAVEYSLEEGIMKSVGIVGGERGRKAQLYSLDADYMHFIFASIHGQKLHFQVHNFLSCVLKSGVLEVTDENIFSSLENVIETCIKSDSLIRFVGVAFSGTVYHGKIIESFDFPSLIGFELKKYLEEKFSIIAIVENDLHCAVAAFSKYSSGYKDGITVAYYFGNEGYGSGILIDGKLLHGACGSAGELYNVVVANKVERSNFTYAEILRSLTSILNPNRVILYPNGTADLNKVKSLAFHEMPTYQMPALIENRSFTKDTFIGLVALCKEKLIEPYAKVQVLKLEIK